MQVQSGNVRHYDGGVLPEIGGVGEPRRVTHFPRFEAVAVVHGPGNEHVILRTPTVEHDPDGHAAFGNRAGDDLEPRGEIEGPFAAGQRVGADFATPQGAGDLDFVRALRRVREANGRSIEQTRILVPAENKLDAAPVAGEEVFQAVGVLHGASCLSSRPTTCPTSPMNTSR